MSPTPSGRDDARGTSPAGGEPARGEGDGPRSGGSAGSRPVVTGTAAARYNAPRPENGRSSAPSDAERTQLFPAVTDDPPAAGGSGAAGSTGSSGSSSSSSGSGGSSSGSSGSGAARAAGGAGADQPPWQRGRGTAVVDAPTSSIKRSQLPTDMPDLSSPRAERTERTAAPSPRRSSSTTDEPAPRSAAARVGSAAGRGSRKGPRRASLQLKHVDPWSTLKLSLVLSVAMFLVWMVAVGVLYLVLDTMGVWERLNSTFSEFVSSSDPGSTAAPLVGPGRVFGLAAVIGAVNIVLLTALATIGSFIYNLSADLAGGVEVTLTERD